MRTILTLARTDEGKRIRRSVGDYGGIGFRQGKTMQPKQESMSNKLTNVQKDNLLFEVYDNTNILRC